MTIDWTNAPEGAIPRPTSTAIPVSEQTQTLVDAQAEIERLSVRTQRLLISAGILTLSDLVSKTESELLDIKGLGKKRLAGILEALNVEAMDLIQFAAFR